MAGPDTFPPPTTRTANKGGEVASFSFSQLELPDIDKNPVLSPKESIPL
jgi:hypothetical protein